MFYFAIQYSIRKNGMSYKVSYHICDTIGEEFTRESVDECNFIYSKLL